MKKIGLTRLIFSTLGILFFGGIALVLAVAGYNDVKSYRDYKPLSVVVGYELADTGCSRAGQGSSGRYYSGLGGKTYSLTDPKTNKGYKLHCSIYQRVSGDTITVYVSQHSPNAYDDQPAIISDILEVFSIAIAMGAIAGYLMFSLATGKRY